MFSIIDYAADAHIDYYYASRFTPLFSPLYCFTLSFA